jgi:hypothetical protein
VYPVYALPGMRSPAAAALLGFALLAGYAGSRRLGAADLPAGYWSEAESGKILAKTLTLRLAPDLADLKPGERQAVAKLLAAGQIFQSLYEESNHPQALAARDRLADLDRRLGSPAATRNLLTLYRLFQGPVATTLDNARLPFLPVDAPVPGRNVYPWGVKKEEIESFLAAHPAERAALLHLRSVVRRADRASLDADLATLARHPALDLLHPGLTARLERLRAAAPAASGTGFYAVPYAVAYAERLLAAYGLLQEAADAVEPEDGDFAHYLRNRARDLLSDDYEAGDASWITGRFGNLNAQIGSYEVYDDELLGVKTFFGLSLLKRDARASEALLRALRGLPGLEDALPYDAHKRVREDIPVGVYDVIADFGQARGANTATNLPNESTIARKYGRLILLRANIMRSPQIFAVVRARWQAALAAEHRDDLDPGAEFQRTLWHEVGHYLGPDLDRRGRDLNTALGAAASPLEEMKADLVSLFVGRALRAQGYYDDARLHALYAGGIERVLQPELPRREEPYATMELMQMNCFLAAGLLEFDRGAGVLRIHYDRYHEVVAALLQEVLALQRGGDAAAAERFIDRYTAWTPELHGVLARKIQASETARFRLVLYSALGD